MNRDFSFSIVHDDDSPLYLEKKLKQEYNLARSDYKIISYVEWSIATYICL